MKKTIILPFLLASLFTFSQGSKIAFTMSGTTPVVTGALTDLKLPLQISFTPDFNTKELSFKNNIDKIKFNETQVFGTGDLKFHGTDPFVYTIEEDMKTNPGENNVPSTDILLTIAGKDFNLKLKEVVNDGTTGGTKQSKDYDAGYIYYDVLKLLDKKTIPQTKQKILSAYGVNQANLKKNPYLNDVFGSTSEKVNVPEGGEISSLLGSLGNTDVTYFAAGLARFLAERTKVELNEAFFSKMKEQLNAYPELKTVFPKTASFLDVIETYSYASVIQVLKEAFETDIQNLPANLYEIKNLDASKCSSITKDKLKTSCEERMTKLKTFFESQDGRWVGLGMFTVKEAITSTNPSNLLKSVVESDDLKGVKNFSKTNFKYDDYNIAASIELSNLISRSLVSTDEKQVYINTYQLSSLFKTKDAFKVYLGLLLAHEQMSDSKIDFYMSDNSLKTFEKILIDEYSKYQEFESLVKNVHSAFNSANNAVKKMVAATDKSVEIDPQALYDYYRTFTSSLKPIAHSPLLKTITGKDIGADYDKVEQFLNPAVDIAYHISTKKYSAAIYDASILLSSLDNVVDEKMHPVFKPVTKSFVKYGTLISTVANAQSSDEVKQALDASVLPVGSSAIKRKSAWSISINGYVGGFYGKAYSTIQDTLRNVITSKLDTITKPISYRTFGLYAPVGLSFNRGFKSGWGITLNAQILDLGALVNFYLTKGDKASLPTDFKVKLSDILSPGIQLGINIPKTPLTIMGGMQYVPALNHLSQISTSQLSPIAWRAQLGIVVDIPLYNLKVWDFRK